MSVTFGQMGLQSADQVGREWVIISSREKSTGEVGLAEMWDFA